MHPLASRRILRSVVVLVLPLLLIGAAASAVLADPAVLDWTDTWGGPGDHNDEATFAFADPGGDGVLVAGTTIRRPDIRTLAFARRLGADGLADWTTIVPPDTLGTLRAAVPLDGGVVLVGRGAGLQLVAVGADGSLQWVLERPFPAALDFSSEVRAVRGPGDRIYAAAGTAAGFFLVVVSPAGVVERETTITTTTLAYNLNDLVVDAAGDVYLGAWLGEGSSQWLSILRVDPTDAVLWRQDTTGDIGSVFGNLRLALLPGGDVVAAGNPESICGVFRVQVWSVAAADGGLLWSDVLTEGPCASAAVRRIAVDATGDVVVLADGGLDEASLGDRGFVVARYAPDGERRWARVVPSGVGSSDLDGALALTADGGVVVTGRSIITWQLQRLVTFSLAPDGELRWLDAWSAGPALSSSGQAVVVAPGGVVYVVGTTWNADVFTDAVTLRYHHFTASAVAPLPATGGGLEVAPLLNPFSGSTRVRFRLPADASFTLAVYDVAGRRVRLLRTGQAAAGPHEVTWSGRDDNGRVLPSGTYLLRLETARGAVTRRVGLLR